MLTQSWQVCSAWSLILDKASVKASKMWDEQEQGDKSWRNTKVNVLSSRAEPSMRAVLIRTLCLGLSKSCDGEVGRNDAGSGLFWVFTKGMQGRVSERLFHASYSHSPANTPRRFIAAIRRTESSTFYYGS